MANKRASQIESVEVVLAGLPSLASLFGAIVTFPCLISKSLSH